MINPKHPITRRSIESAQASAKTLGVKLQLLEVREPKDFEPAFSAMTRERADALFVCGGPLFNTNRKLIYDLALAHRLPIATYTGASFVRIGALMSYSIHISPMYRRAAHYVDKILKGADPAEMPVERPTHYRLTINLKTAKKFGITIPQSLLIQATGVIE